MRDNVEMLPKVVPLLLAVFGVVGALLSLILVAAIYRMWFILKGSLPFTLCKVLAMFLLWLFPQIATWLPDAVMGKPRCGTACKGCGYVDR